MFRMNTYILLSVLLVTGCSTLKDHSVYKDHDGLFRTEIRKEKNAYLSAPERVLRDKDGHLITDEKSATDRLHSLKDPIELDESFRYPSCNQTKLFQAKELQFQAQEELRNKNYKVALEKLDAAESKCKNIGLISAQDYYVAAARSGLGENQKAKEAATRFLQDSAAYDPAVFEQADGPGPSEDFERFQQETAKFGEFRRNAEQFLRSGAPLNVSLAENDEAKFAPNNFFRPGGSRRAGAILVPAFSFDQLLGFNAGAAFYRSWGKFGIGLSYVGGSLGSFVGAKVRQSVYESTKRDWNVDVFGAGYTHKRLTYKYDGIRYSDVTLENTYFEPGAGVGVTKRFTPQFGLAAEGAVFANQINQGTDVLGSFYAFYDVWENTGPSLGYIQNRPMVAWSLLFIQVGYNFKDQSLDMVLQGFTF